MVRKLKYHEQKLLKKVDFITWDEDNSPHENKIMRRYQVEKREHYTLYNKFSREVCSKDRSVMYDASNGQNFRFEIWLGEFAT